MTYAQRHARLLLPCDPPLRPAEGASLPPPPALWRRAQMLFARLAAHAGDLAALARRSLRPQEHRDLLGQLEPVEKLVRGLVILRALTFLLMTPEGRRLMRDTPKSSLPRKPAFSAANDSHPLAMPHPGWNTIAHHAACVAQPTDAAERSDSAAERSAFRICAWRFPKGDAPPQPRPAASAPLILALDADPFPRLAAPHSKREQAPGNSGLVRRIAALSRVIADPARPAARLARWFARLPREALQGLTETFVRPRAWWRHAVEEAIAAAAHLRRAACALLLHPEPG